jgi:protein-L-isoaspartate(D-aspartate) O-methyltransferase
MTQRGAEAQIALPLGAEPHPASAAAQSLMAFLLRLRAAGIADTAVLRALETVPREMFAPHRFADLALRDIALPIPCGQIMPEPLFVARAIEALSIEPSHSVLEIGSGSGYTTAILARLAARVVSVEWFEPLAVECAARLRRLGIDNATVLRGDGLALAPSLGLFDRILLNGAIYGLPDDIAAALAEGGVVVFSRPGEADQGALVAVRDSPGQGLIETTIGHSRLGRLIKSMVVR